MPEVKKIRKMMEYFNFLDQLRESGETNMFGAGPYLQEAFGITNRAESAYIVGKWMKTFSDEESVKERAKKALSLVGEE